MPKIALYVREEHHWYDGVDPWRYLPWATLALFLICVIGSLP